MEYRLLNDGCGVILTRQPEIISEELAITFTGAPDGAVAIFSHNGTSHYRELNEGCCVLSVPFLTGEISVRVIHYNGSARPPSWSCEGIIAKDYHGGVLVAPDDNNLPLEVTRLKIANHELRDGLTDLEKKYTQLYEKLNSLMEGYDLT